MLFEQFNITCLTQIFKKRNKRNDYNFYVDLIEIIKFKGFPDPLTMKSEFATFTIIIAIKHIIEDICVD